MAKQPKLYGDPSDRLQWAFFLAAQDAGENILRALYLAALADKAGDSDLAGERTQQAIDAAREMTDYITLRHGAFDADVSLYKTAYRDGYQRHLVDAQTMVKAALAIHPGTRGAS